jgi:hypothetical protein
LRPKFCNFLFRKVAFWEQKVAKPCLVGGFLRGLEQEKKRKRKKEKNSYRGGEKIETEDQETLAVLTVQSARQASISFYA